MNMQKAIFMDRDGVVNKLPDKYPNEGIGDVRNYITRWEDFVFLPGVLDAFILIEMSDYIPVIVSNQGGLIGRKIGGVDWNNPIKAVFSKMQRCIGRISGQFTPYYFCPHLHADKCACCKPKPGMLYQAAIEHNIILEESWMIGDSDVDIQAGIAAGIPHCIKIMETGHYTSVSGESNKAWIVKTQPSLLKAVEYILSRDA